MAKIETVKCDECGAIKQKLNHWWKGSDEPAGMLLWAAEWGDTYLHMTATHDLCSDACVVMFTQKWLSGRKFAVESSTGE